VKGKEDVSVICIKVVVQGKRGDESAQKSGIGYMIIIITIIL